MVTSEGSTLYPFTKNYTITLFSSVTLTSDSFEFGDMQANLVERFWERSLFLLKSNPREEGPFLSNVI